MTMEEESITFDRDDWRAPSRERDEQPALVRWIMRCSGGLVRSERQAHYVLIGLAIASFLVTVWLFTSSRGATAPSAAQRARIIENQANAYPQAAQ